MRGLERDTLVERPTFKRFLRNPPQDATSGTVYLVSTSAGEVGVNITADHLVCDLTPFDSMAQRFGRVNRFGKGNAHIDVVHPESFEDKDFERAREHTLELLKSLPERPDGRFHASPKALGAKLDEVGPTIRDKAFTPPREILPTSEILFDAWSLTTVTMQKDPRPGRPPVADWLHGVPNDWEPPETYVAWREEVAQLTPELREEHDPEEVLDDFPLKPRELLRDTSKRVYEALKAISEKHPTQLVWAQSADGTIEVVELKALVNRIRSKDASELNGMVLILPPAVGGLTEQGMLDGAADYDPSRHLTTWRAEAEDSEDRPITTLPKSPYDVSEVLNRDDELRHRVPQRTRTWKRLDDTKAEQLPAGTAWRSVRRITISGADSADDEGQNAWLWTWWVSNDPAAGTDSSTTEQGLSNHLASADAHATKIVQKVEVSEPERSAVIVAARFHDLGKSRSLWQYGIGNRDLSKPLAKSGGWSNRFTHTYRHEFGSLLDVRDQPEFQSLPEEARDLVLHLIAAHHGRARPHFPAPPDRAESFDPEQSDELAAEMARSVPRRFARLQRRYGRWGLAWLETLVRCADVLASKAVDASQKGPNDH
jgi:CRISPR-associated endonuclease/helicase Cas3